MTVPVAAVMTVLHEQPERLGRRLTELAAQEEQVDEVVIAAPAADHPAIEATVPREAAFVLRLVDNPTGERSVGLNLAARAAGAEVLIRVDARSSLSTRHVKTCAGILRSRPEVGVVGGPQLPVPGADGVLAQGISRALSNPWALGGAAYRRADARGAVDTVYLGAFRSEELLDVGGYDERLVANEDFELCQRYRSRGLLVWLDERAAVSYESRSTLSAVASQYFAFGCSKVRFWRLTGATAQARQVLAMVGMGSGAAGLAWALRRPRRLAPFAAVGFGLLCAIDAAGGPARPAPLAVRGAAALTYPVVWLSWGLGIVRESIRGGR